MFVIKPIQDKTEQENFCVRCGIPYDVDCLAYGAYIDNVFSGMAQFRIKDGFGYIRHLVPLPGVTDFEVMFIMGRAAMNFIDLCGTHICFAATDAGDTRLLKAIGFQETDGRLRADMTHMFDGSHCAGHDAKNIRAVEEMQNNPQNNA